MKTFMVLPEGENSKSPENNLFTKTWSLKKYKDIERPRTATLSEPKILNPMLINTIDMSLVTKEFLTTDLCKLTTPRSEYSTESSSDKNNNTLSNKNKIRSINSNVNKAFPEPCRTCGRPDLPERFHSHPTTPIVKQKQTFKIKTKNTVQKPMAIKFKSKCKAIPNIINEVGNKEGVPQVPEKSPKTLICYICGREFGTASLSLHEPKCLEKWRLENSHLPENLRKSTPTKPTSFSNKLEWNTLAWKTFQNNLVPCLKCGRTFYPDRLLVHQRGCKENNEINTIMSSDLHQLNPSKKLIKPLPGKTVRCSVCGKLYGTKSIKFHEPQCIKKYKQENGFRPNEQNNLENSENKNIPVKKPNMFPCYLCGRLFSINSIYIHEPHCLKKWRIDNEKLPIDQRRKEPVRPDIKFTEDGKIDLKALEEANWETHLKQLVPCKYCKRTFNPDRVEKHQRSCKGPN